MMTAGELDGEDESDDRVGEDEPRRKRRKLVGGGSLNNKRNGEECMDECKLCRALPDMANTLESWTLHWQNLGSYLTVNEYCWMSQTQHCSIRFFGNIDLSHLRGQ